MRTETGRIFPLIPKARLWECPFAMAIPLRGGRPILTLPAHEAELSRGTYVPKPSEPAPIWWT